MSYADSIRAATATMEDVASLVEGLLISKTVVSQSTAAQSSTSASYVPMTGMSLTVTVPASPALVILRAHVSLAHSTLNKYSFCAISEDSTGTVLPNCYRAIFKEPIGDTSGYRVTVSTSVFTAPSAGSHTYRILWATEAATVYSTDQYLEAIVIRGS
jgi:hypothetical protein